MLLIGKSPSRVVRLNTMQQGIFLAHFSDENEAVYNVQVVIKLFEEVDQIILNDCWEEVQCKYEHFSAGIFRESLGGSHYVLGITTPVPKTRILDLDISHYKEDSQKDLLLKNILESDEKKPFELGRPPLLRSVLIKYSNNNYFLVFTFHHILFDGNSFLKFVADLFNAYDAKIKKTNYEIKEVSYPEAVDPIRTLTKEEKLYWHNLFSDYEESNILSIYRDRPITGRRQISRVKGTLSKEVSNRIIKRSKQYGITINLFFEIAWCLLFSKYSYSDDIVYFSVRSFPNKGEVGVFINSFPIRCKLSSEFRNVRDLFNFVKSQHKQIKNYHFHSLKDILSSAKIDPSKVKMALDYKSISPLLFLKKYANQESWKSREGYFNTRTHYDLFVEIAKNVDAFDLKINFREDLFEAQSIELLLSHYRSLLDSLSSLEGDCSLREVVLINQSELLEKSKAQFYGRKNNLIYPNFIAGFYQVANQYKHEIAIQCGSSSCTYQMLSQYKSSSARFFKKIGVAEGKQVLIHLDRSLDMIVVLLAIAELGASYLPVDTAIPTKRLTRIIHDSRVDFVVTHYNNFFKFKDSTLCPVIAVEEINYKNNHWIDLNFHSHAKKSLAYTIYTSGSTGKPKGVDISHASLINLLLSAQSILKITSADVFLAITSFGFDISILELILPLISGSKLILADNESCKDPFKIIRMIKSHGVTILQATPSMWKLLLDAGWCNEGSVKVLCGGEGLNKETASRLLSHGNGFWHCYGPTETTIWSSICYIEKISEVNILAPIGQPIDNTSLFILDKQQQLLPPNLIGEIYIGGLGLSKGYRQESLTKQKFKTITIGDEAVQLYQTGDLGYWREDGLIEFKGRVDDQVKINGYRVELGEIERALSSLPYVNFSSVLCCCEKNHSSLVAFIEVNDKTINTENIKSELRETLPEYMIPSDIRRIDTIPLNSNGKLDRIKLLSTYSGREGVQTVDTAGNTVSITRDLFCKVLRFDPKKVTENTDFFSFGGDSLSALSLVIEIQKKFMIELTIRDIYSHPSIKDLADFIAEKCSLSEVKVKPDVSLSDHKETALTDFQHRLWVLNFLDNNAYNISMIVKLEGGIDLDAFKKSIQSIIFKHPGLLIQIKQKDKKVVQSVCEDWCLNSVCHVEHLDEAYSNIEEILLKKASSHYFDLTRDVLFKIKITCMPGNISYLTFLAHHIVLDEWSVNILLGEISYFYNCYKRHELSVNEYEKDNYLGIVNSDFIEKSDSWEKESEAGRFWVNYLKGISPLNFLYDYPKPKVQTFEGATYLFTVHHELACKINDLVIEKRSTLMVFFTSILNLLFYSYTNQDSFTIGIPNTIRGLGSEGIVGPFINTLPLRFKFNPEISFSSFMSQVHDDFLLAISYGAMPFEKIVEILDIDFDTSENPIFQVFLTTQKNYLELFRLEGIQATKLIAPKDKSKFNISFYVSEVSNGLNISIEYRTDLFKAGTIERLSATFLSLINQVVDDCERPLSQIRMLSSLDAYLLDQWNNTDLKLTYETVLDSLKQIAEQVPNKIAVKFNNQTLSYNQLLKYSEALTSLLINDKSQDRLFCVGIFLTNSTLLPIAILGVLYAGAAYLPIDPNYPVERINYFIHHSKLSVILCDRFTVDAIHSIINKIGLSIKVINLSDINLSQVLHTQFPIITGDDLAYIIYTSGSTGSPKGVAVSHRSLMNLITGMKVINLTSSDHFLSITSMSFDIFGLELFLPLTTGATLFLTDKVASTNRELLKQILIDEKISAVQATPITWRGLLDAGWTNDGTIKVICGGEALNKTLAGRLLSKNRGFWHCYGPTETTIWSTCSFIETVDEAVEWVSIGKPISNTKVFILNQYKQEVPIGVEGEIYISGLGLAKEYWKDSALTRHSFLTYRNRDNQFIRVYKTGDRGFWNEHGTLEYVGRSDDQIKLRGHRIEIGEVEFGLSKYPLVKESAVSFSFVNKEEPCLKAYVVPHSKEEKQLDFSLFFFPSSRAIEGDPYELYFKSVQCADDLGFKAVWTPERHFDELGGQFPNPSILAAALSQQTKNIQIRAGSIVLPLHNPIRIAEDWATIDRLSQGRVGVAFASGWHPQDFVLNPQAYQDRKKALIEGVKTVHKLWSNQSVAFIDGMGAKRDIQIFPKPLQEKLPTWITAAVNADTFRLAGELGCNLLTHLLGQNLRELSDKIKLYRETLKDNGYDPRSKIVTLAVHTYLDQSQQNAIEMATPFFKKYLKSHSDLLQKFDLTNENISSISEEDLDFVIEHALERFLESNSLIGSPRHVARLLHEISRVGVDEVACLIDFGIPNDFVMESIQLLYKIKDAKHNVTELDALAIKQFLSNRLPSYMIPDQIIQLSELPRTLNNKIDRKALHKINVAPLKQIKIEPKTEVEHKLLDCIYRVYPIDQVGLEMQLHDLGGNSLLTVQLISEIESTFNIRLSIQSIFSADNVQSLSQIICNSLRQKNEAMIVSKEINQIITLREGEDDKPPLFLIHPVGGTVFCYRPLAQYVTRDIPVYGIQDPAILTNEMMFSSLSEMVEFYLASIGHFTSAQEIYLAGSSFGGTIALELASCLEKINKRCLFVGLFDTWAVFPDDLKRKSYFEKNMERQHQMLCSAFEDYNIRNSKQWLDLQWHRQVLLMDYRPRPAPLRQVTLFKAQELLPEYQLINENRNYWGEYLVNPFTVELVPGNHETLLKEPNVKVLGRKLSTCINTLPHSEVLEKG